MTRQPLSSHPYVFQEGKTMSSPESPASSRAPRVRAIVTGLSLGAAALLLAGCASATTSTKAPADSTAFKPVKQDTSAGITVWADSTRLPMVQAYQKLHSDVKMNVVTYDGGADGSNYLQTKVQLFDRTGSGWPDVVFAPPTDEIGRASCRERE